MNIEDLLKTAATAFSKSPLSGKAGSSLDLGSLATALMGLLGGGKGGLDLGSLLSGLQGGGLASIASSWLGDGENASISPDQVNAALGEDKVAKFAEDVGVSPQEAAGGLSDALPQLVDTSSSGGSVLDSIGGLSGAMDLAKKLF